jgi:hypothetical protein
VVFPDGHEDDGVVKARTAVRLAWSLWLLSVLLLAAGLPLGELAGVGLRGLVESATYATVGAIVASRHSQNPIAWLFCALGVVVAFEFFATEYSAKEQVIAPGSLAGAGWMAWAAGASTDLSIPLVVSVLLLFPHGLLSPGWRVAVWLAAAAGTVSVGTTVLLAVGMAGRFPPDEAGVPSDISNLAQVLEVSEAFLGISVVVSALSVVLRQRRAVGDERQQLKWFTYAVGLVVGAAFISAVVTGGDARFALWLTPAIPIAAGIAILKYRLYDIDVIINRTLVYGALTALLGVTYFLIVAVVSLLIGESNLTVAGATLAVAALAQPARAHIQGFIDKRFYRRKYDAERILEAFSTRLRHEVDLDAMSADLRSVARETMQPTHISLWLRH